MEEQTRYICRDCRYKFRRKTTWQEDLCPYCGQTTIEREDTINKMIRDEL